MREPDFTGWATKNDLRCSDGVTIRKGAFAHNDKKQVPLVWQHMHNSPDNVLGHAILENRAFGVYTQGFFNQSDMGQQAKLLLEHGDVNKLSIYANQLQKKGMDVVHGEIQEVSLVLAGANPGALIEWVNIQHGDSVETSNDEAIIHTGLELGDDDNTGEEELTPKVELKPGEKPAEEQQQIEHAEAGATVADVYDAFDDSEKAVVNFMIGQALADAGVEVDAEGNVITHKEDGDNNIQHNQGGPKDMNVFEDAAKGGDTLQHGARPRLTKDQLETIMNDARDLGSYKKSFLAHAEDYGITNIDLMFPDAKTLMDSPDFVKRRTEWVNRVLGGTKHAPFARIRTLFADITLDSARAKGYITGNMKKEEFFSLSKRVTTPQTVYKKQKLDRDDIIDVTELDVVAWLKAEMRLMLDEEIARAILIGDGREVDDEDKIKDPASNSDGAGIRSIAHDHSFYAHPVVLATNASNADVTEAIIRSFDMYHGSGSPTMYCLRGFLTDLLLQKDKMGRRLYRSKQELADELGVDEIIDVEVLSNEPTLLAIIVNLQDYTVGTDKGGETNFFDDFDIDYNQYKYLYETRMSGALTKWKSALVIKRTAGTLATPSIPTFVSSTGVVTIPTVTGVVYKNQDTDATLASGAQTAIAAGATISVQAVPAAGYYFPYNFDADWDFTRDA